MFRLFMSRASDASGAQKSHAAHSPKTESTLRRSSRLAGLGAAAGALAVLFVSLGTEAGTVNRQTAPSSLGDLAASYRSVVRDMETFTSMSFRSMDDVTRSRSLIARYDPAAIVEGWFVHHAMLVANDTRFAGQITTLADDMGRDALLTRLDQDPSYLRNTARVDTAVSIVQDAVNDMTAQMAATKELVVDRANELQYQRAGIEPPSRVTASTPAELVSRYDRRGLYAPHSTPERARPVIDQVLVLAARISLDAVHGDDLVATRTLTTERGMKRCVTFSKLNMNQCVAAVRFPHEEAFCLGRHGVGELGECWRWMLGSI